MELTREKLINLPNEVAQPVVDIEKYGFVTSDNLEPSIKVLYTDLGDWGI